MDISPNYNDGHWKKLGLSLDSPNDKWREATGILKDRIEGRFLKPVHLIEKYKYAGFAVLALDCLLIETL